MSRSVRRWIVTVSVVVVAALLGGFLYVREERIQRCEAWREALIEISASSRGLGAGTAGQFRQEAIRRGWVDTGEGRVHRPGGCIP